MTNILYFSTINRDEESATSSSSTATSEPPQTAAQTSLYVYKIIGKAWRAFARPHLPVDGDDDDGSTTSASIGHEDSTKEIKSTAKPLSTYVKPTPRGYEYASSFSYVRYLSYRELKNATNGFHGSRELGSSESGTVFKGWINKETWTATEAGNGIAVAVKRIYQGKPEGVTNWLQEIGYLGRFDHPNLVETIGYCAEGEERILVYEFMPQGSLKDHLFDRGSDSEPLSWSLGMKVALGAAKCLQFLHTHGARHGNGKPSNILLDSDYYPKLSFGDGKGSFEEIETPYGPYRQPNSVNVYNALDRRSVGQNGTGDVYSFGVVLLEILIGRKIIPTELRLVLKGGQDKVISLLDKSLPKDQHARRDAKEVAGLVILCLQECHKYRETMDLVVQCLTRFTNDVTKS